MKGIYATVFYRGRKPELIEACIRANLAGCAYQDKDINEQHRDAKKNPACADTQNGKVTIMVHHRHNSTRR